MAKPKTRKLVAFDIDGTLLNSDRKVLEGTKEVVKKLQDCGHLVTLATGRNLQAAKPIIRELNFENYILCNGAYAFVKHELVYSNPIDKEELKRLVEVANRENVYIMYQTMHQVKEQKGCTRDFDSTLLDIFNMYAPESNFNIDREPEIYQAVMFCGEEKIAEIHDEFTKFRFTRWHEGATDVVPSDGSKANTILSIAAQAGIPQEDIISFGDGENDIEMLSISGIGIAMGNAVQKLKKKADIITDTNDCDGIYKIARELELV